MADLRSFKKHEVFLILKRDLAMVIFFSFFFLLSVHFVFSYFLSLYFCFNYFFINAIQAMHIDKELVSDSHK